MSDCLYMFAISETLPVSGVLFYWTTFGKILAKFTQKFTVRFYRKVPQQILAEMSQPTTLFTARSETSDTKQQTELLSLQCSD